MCPIMQITNLQTTLFLYLIEPVYLVTNYYLHYQRYWKDREGQDNEILPLSIDL